MTKFGVLISVYFSCFLFLAMQGCKENTEVNEVKPYEGPLLEVENMETLYSDSAIVRVRVKAKKQLEYQSGDSEFPEGIFIEFYEVDGTISSTLEANKAYHKKDERLYTATGDVEVNSYKKDEKLNTEELHWKQEKQEIFTDKFVRIETNEEILLGEGLTASQDFSTYRILKPTGELSIEKD